MNNKLLRLNYFLSGYYHQDWHIDAGSTNEKDLWEFYFNHEKIQEDKALEYDIFQLLQCSDEKILSTLSEFQCDGRYWGTSESAKGWLLKLQTFVCNKNT